MAKTAQTLGSRIREARMAAGFDVGVAFAAEIGVKPHTLWRYENGKIRPSADVLHKIARACGVSMESLLGEPSKDLRTGTDN